MGKRKPWLPLHAKNPPDDVESIDAARTTTELWYHVLRKVNKDLDLGIDIQNIEIGLPPLGLFPTNNMVKQSYEARNQKELE